MYTLLYIPILAKEAPIPFQESHKEFKKDDLFIVQLEDKKYDQASFIHINSIKAFEKEIQKNIKIIRPVTKEDRKKLIENAENIQKNKEDVLQLIAKENLAMHLSEIIFSFDNKTMLITFSAENRVDFRNLVRILAGNFKKKVLLHQIGARDQAKQVNGFGVCGRKLCCSNFLHPMPSVSMDAPRDQNIAFKGAEALSGLCGKLKCCLNYESQQYKELKRKFPKFGSSHKIDGIEQVIIGMDILNGKIKLRSEHTYSTIDLEEFAEKKIINKQINK